MSDKSNDKENHSRRNRSSQVISSPNDNNTTLSKSIRVKELMSIHQRNSSLSGGTANVSSTAISSSHPTSAQTPPLSYTSNTQKERICLEYIRQFCNTLNFPSIKEILEHHNIPTNNNHKKNNKSNSVSDYYLNYFLFIAPNEYGVDKCVCSAIRPTLLPYSTFYDYRECALFLAHFLEYEPLSTTPNDEKEEKAESGLLNLCLPSPTSVLEWYIGDCFDYSTLLVSFLIGAGYDAFVVYGTAPKYVCKKDQQVLECPSDNTTTHSNEEEEDSNGERKTFYDSTSSSKIPDDSNNNKNLVHAWVLIRGGKRGLKEMTFIEPSTGQIFSPIHTSPYYSIRSIWNHENYWMNLQSQHFPSSSSSSSSSSSDLADISFDLTDSKLWKPVFPDDNYDYHNNKTPSTSSNETEKKQKQQQQQQQRPAPFLDVRLPNSWVHKILIDHQLFETRYPPNGQRVILYKKAKLELYCKDINQQALASRKMTFRDDNRIELIECQERFFSEERRDQMYERIRYPQEFKFIERFQATTTSNSNHTNAYRIKEWVEVSGQHRKIYFYASNARLDGLVYMEDVFGKYIICRFQGRFDLMKTRIIYFDHVDNTDDRSEKENINMTKNGNDLNQSGLRTSKKGGKGTIFLPNMDGGNSLLVVKVIEEYEANETTTVNDVSKRTFFLLENKVGTEYHHVDHVLKKKEIHNVRRGSNNMTKKKSTEDCLQSTKSRLSSLSFRTNNSSTFSLSSARSNFDIHKRKINDSNDAAFVENLCLTSTRSMHQDLMEMVRHLKNESNRSRSNKNLVSSYGYLRNATNDSSSQSEVKTNIGRNRNLSNNNINKGIRKGNYAMDENKADSEDVDNNKLEGQQIDFLFPYLKHIADMNDITKDEARTIRDCCVQTLKERLIERTNIIQNRLDQENTRLSQYQAVYQQQQSHSRSTTNSTHNTVPNNDSSLLEEEQSQVVFFSQEEFEKICSEIKFKIKVLEHRLAQNEQSAVEKCKALENKLAMDSRMKCIQDELTQ